MPGISFITHKEAKIAYQDWSYAKPDEILTLIERAKAMVAIQPKHSALVLINVKGASFNLSVSNALREFAKNQYALCQIHSGVWRGRLAGSHLQGYYNVHRQEKHCSC